MWSQSKPLLDRFNRKIKAETLNIKQLKLDAQKYVDDLVFWENNVEKPSFFGPKEISVEDDKGEDEPDDELDDNGDEAEDSTLQANKQEAAAICTGETPPGLTRRGAFFTAMAITALPGQTRA